MPIREILGITEFDAYTPEETRAALAAGEIVLIDVRTPQEYAVEHIEGALLMPMAFFAPRFLPPQDSRRIVLHCGSGMRSTRMAERCAAAGFDRIAHMAGGMSAWKERGLPYIATDPATGGPVRK